MEDLLLSYCEHQILQKYKAKLESRYTVKMNMPEVKSNDSCGAQEVIFINIVGDNQNINNVKKFLKRKVDMMRGQEEQENNASVIILNSDSENDSDLENILPENNINKPKRKKPRLQAPVIDLETLAGTAENNNESCDVTSTTNELDESVIVIEAVPSAEDFIPLFSKETHKNAINRSTPSFACDIIEISSDEEETSDQSSVVPRTVPRDPKLLRPVVIDGSNVARSHGKPSNTYSCKGIKLSVEYFLKRGHSQVTAFVPLYRRHCKNGPIITTDQEILEELEKTQHVVFTPSRSLKGKSYSCYDDRFIVELAVANGGVILSNDNFKDLMCVSPAFKETIEKRLLMFCFVGDMLMIPEDPLGAKGPNLEEFLSFPPAVE